MQDVGEALEMDGSALADILGKALQVQCDRCMHCKRAFLGYSTSESGLQCTCGAAEDPD